jgi:hypothetical protein
MNSALSALPTGREAETKKKKVSIREIRIQRSHERFTLLRVIA